MSNPAEGVVRSSAPAIDRSLIEAPPIRPTLEGEVIQVTEQSGAANGASSAGMRADTRKTLRPVNPEDLEQPTMGLPKFKQRLENKKATNQKREPVIILPNRQEARLRQRKRIERKRAYLVFVSMGKKRIIMSANSKGGSGKTPDIGYASTIQMDITRVPTLCVDANENIGTMHNLFGLDDREDTLQLRDAVENRHKLSTYADVAQYAYKHPSGVLLISSDAQKAGKHLLEVNAFIHAAEIWNKSFPATYFDIGNGVGDVSNVGSALVANVILFSAYTGKESSFGALVETMIQYQDMNFEDKVNNSFIVINGTQPGETAEDYMKKLAAELVKFPRKGVHNEQTHVTETLERRLGDLGITEDRVFLIPYSDHIQKDSPISVDPEVIGYDTYEAYLDLLIAVYLQDNEYPAMTLESLSVPPPAERAHMASITPPPPYRRAQAGQHAAAQTAH